MALDYNATLNLPKTDFQMRAGLPQKEPVMLDAWEQEGLYQKIIRRGEGKPKYILHDGPPYANGNIHLGTAMNKVLKDIVVRSKNMLGYQAPYVPGWDTHGLPIERKAIQELGLTERFTQIELRKKCREFALHYVDIQKEEFKRLGVLGDFEHPYLTLQPQLEAEQIRIFGTMAQKGYIYKGLKPVYWCTDCHTALAEAEIEYAQDPCDSIYVKFLVEEDKGVLKKLGCTLGKTFIVIWTTTTWTLPGNLAICLGPEYDYCAVHTKGESLIMARELVESVMEAADITDYEISGTIPGKELEGITYHHPFLDRVSPVIVGDHVTLDSGTGCVHTAPGHGVEDFEVCARYDEIPVIVPVDNAGVLTAEAGSFAGLTTEEANKAIVQYLEGNGNLLAIAHIQHQYPHCWRCKNPILFRATEQWFCSIDGFKKQALEAIKEVQWIPGWGENKIASMVENRSDWCISRQRSWGVPIPVFYCNGCSKYLAEEETVEAVAKLFGEKGSDAWYTMEAEEILPQGYQCPHCGDRHFTKEKDIMDVWFDSGSTHRGVLGEHWNLPWPADLYLEGHDQYRGWFQSSLLTAVATKGQAPYRAVCTHGWVVDGEGRKQSKSLGNVNAPKDIIDDYGADILRLWVASSDYHSDVRVSFDYIKQLSEGYRKIRNTARYILGNIHDFDPDTQSIPLEELPEIDRWALARMEQLLERSVKAYNDFDFYLIYHAVHNFCSVDLSSFYLDVLKDRLYVEKTDGHLRRSAQTTIYRILRQLTLLLAPILPFTAEEIWKYLPTSRSYESTSVMLNDIPQGATGLVEDSFMAKWDKIHAIRNDVNKALELARAEKVIGKSLEAQVTLYCDGELLSFLRSIEKDLPMLFIISAATVVEGKVTGFTGEVEGLAIKVTPATGNKCERCWNLDHTVGDSQQHPTICHRCTQVLAEQSL